MEWTAVILLIILAEIYWFGTRCAVYLSDIRDRLGRPDENDHVSKSEKD
jgi:hypothetical protein